MMFKIRALLSSIGHVEKKQWSGEETLKKIEAELSLKLGSCLKRLVKDIRCEMHGS